MPVISVNPRAYDLSRARKEDSYARFFSRGFETTSVDTMAAVGEIITKSVWSPIVYKDGHRKIANFQTAQFGALDFDTPDYPLAQAMKEWCDTNHVIGLTKNHQREKNGVVCDRFRLVFLYQRPLDDATAYNYNMSLLVAKYGADAAARDAARLFYPCTEIVSLVDDDMDQPIEESPALAAKVLADRFATWKYRQYGKLPKWLDAFLNNGRLVRSKGRNNTIFAAAIEMRKLGFSVDETIVKILASPFPRDSINDSEIVKTISNGYGRL